MALDEADLQKIQDMIVKPFKTEIEALKTQLKTTTDPTQGGQPDKKAAQDSDDESKARMAQLERSLRLNEARGNMPKNINPDRVETALELLEARGQLLGRKGVNYIRIERNGQPFDVPLREGLAEWAGTKDADPFVQAPAGGSGARPGGSSGAAAGAGEKVPVTDVLARLLNEVK